MQTDTRERRLVAVLQDGSVVGLKPPVWTYFGVDDEGNEFEFTSGYGPDLDPSKDIVIKP